MGLTATVNDIKWKAGSHLLTFLLLTAAASLLPLCSPSHGLVPLRTGQVWIIIMKIMYWSVCSQRIASKFTTSFTVTKAAHCNSNILLEHCTHLSLRWCYTDTGNQQQSWNKSHPDLQTHPINFYIKAWFWHHKLFSVGGFEGFYMEWVSLYSIQSFLTKALCFFKPCSSGWCEFTNKERDRAYSRLLSARDVSGSAGLSRRRSIPVPQDTQVFSKAPFLPGSCSHKSLSRAASWNE